VIRLGRPDIGDDAIDGIAAVLRGGNLVQGERVAAFEAGLRARCGVLHAIACSSGTAALHLALAALDPSPDTPVLVPAYTFPATLNVALLLGLPAVLVDVDEATFCITAETVAAALVRCPAGPAPVLLAVHEFGMTAPLDGLDMPDGATVIEDAACAIGSALRVGGAWRPAGSVGRLGCLSFHPRKVLTTGEGGAVTTDDPALAARLRVLRNHGIARDPAGAIEFVEAGWNYRMSEIHAALGLSQLAALDALLADRARIAALYAEVLAPLRQAGLELPVPPPDCRPNWQSYVVRLPRGHDVRATITALRARGVETNHGAQALHREPAYRHLLPAPGLPGADAAWARALALPTPCALSSDDAERVAAALSAVLRGDR
jgi:dTDP-4-amino-4,6-dideoxygalactose transaminase